MPPRKTTTKTQIDSIRHTGAKRPNIATGELSSMLAEEERKPGTLRYPRDSELDPQLVWKGKDQQNAEDLQVPVVPIYIQEKIHPHALIEDLRSSRGQQELAQLYSDFNGITFDDLIDFYHHQQSWTNRMILGDSLQVMASLAEKEDLRGKVQMVYIDPPYGIKFGSNWQVRASKRDVKDGKREEINREPEVIRAFRDTWELGIHSYLSYLRDRFSAARDLLSDTGSVFVQISDENLHLVRCVMDEVFGSNNFAAVIPFTTTSGQSAVGIGSVADYLLWYGKDVALMKYRQLYTAKDPRATGGWSPNRIELTDRERRALSTDERATRVLPSGARPYRYDNLTSQGPSSGSSVFVFRDIEFSPGAQNHWKTTLEGMARLVKADRVELPGSQIQYVRFTDDFAVQPLVNLWTDTTQAGFIDDKVYVVQTGKKVVERCILMTTDPGDLVLDPTCGSGTTAYVAEQWGRRWITVDTSRVALTLARTRLMGARFPYYLLSDSSEGVKKQSEVTGQEAVDPSPGTDRDIRHGFVYKRVPHITLKSIANNEEIDEIYAKWQPQIEAALAAIERHHGRKWNEWDIPRESPDVSGRPLYEEVWRLKRAKQDEIDASIQRSAEYELLYDQPYVDTKRLRVTGPFTFESLSPHRLIPAEDGSVNGSSLPASERDGKLDPGNVSFEETVLDYLLKTGVKGTLKDQRINFDRLESFAGNYLHARGEYTDGEGKTRRVAVVIGPEHGMVDPDLVRRAMTEARSGVLYDLLLVLGFAFDPMVQEVARKVGDMTVLPVRMNSELLMPELKNTGAGNLFMVFGEPDVKVENLPSGQLQVEVLGLDVYNPITGEIRSDKPDDIRCWFIDTNYNDEAFFVRQAYFPGDPGAYEKLRRALKAEVDQGAWAALNTTRSRPFDAPKTGKIAVKLINDFGDEVLKVFAV